MCAMLIIGTYSELKFPCIAEHFGQRCWSHTGCVTNETSSYRIGWSQKEIRPAGRGLPAEWMWDSQLPGWSLGIYPDGLKDFHVMKSSNESRGFYQNWEIFMPLVRLEYCPSLWLCVYWGKVGPNRNRHRQVLMQAHGEYRTCFKTRLFFLS